MFPCFPEHFKIKLPVNMVKTLFQHKKMVNIFENISALQHRHSRDNIPRKAFLPDDLDILKYPVINTIPPLFIRNSFFPVNGYEDRMELFQVFQFKLIKVHAICLDDKLCTDCADFRKRESLTFNQYR